MTASSTAAPADSRRDTRRVLTYREAQGLLDRVGIDLAPVAPIPATGPIGPGDLPLAFPLAVKLDDAGIPHRSDVGGVELGCRDLDDVLRARQRILASIREHLPEHRVRELVVQHQVTGGVELAVGVHQDPSFGPVVSLGPGGVLVELLGRRSYRVPPLSPAVVASMVDDAVPAALLRGYRGAPPPTLDGLIRLLVAVGQLAADAEGELLELDLNPVIVTDDTCTPVDCLAVVAMAGDPGR